MMKATMTIIISSISAVTLTIRRLRCWHQVVAVQVGL